MMMQALALALGVVLAVAADACNCRHAGSDNPHMPADASRKRRRESWRTNPAMVEVPDISAAVGREASCQGGCNQDTKPIMRKRQRLSSRPTRLALPSTHT